METPETNEIKHVQEEWERRYLQGIIKQNRCGNARMRSNPTNGILKS